MEPFHPLLRRALLNDKKHKEQELTPELLMSYEGLVAQLFYLVHYPGQVIDVKGDDVDAKTITEKREETQQVTPDDLREKIGEFRGRYMPNFDVIHQKFVAKQKRAINGSHYDLIPEIIEKIICFFKRRDPGGKPRPGRDEIKRK